MERRKLCPHSSCKCLTHIGFTMSIGGKEKKKFAFQAVTSCQRATIKPELFVELHIKEPETKGAGFGRVAAGWPAGESKEDGKRNVGGKSFGSLRSRRQKPPVKFVINKPREQEHHRSLKTPLSVHIKLLSKLYLLTLFCRSCSAPICKFLNRNSTAPSAEGFLCIYHFITPQCFALVCFVFIFPRMENHESPSGND